MNNGLDSPEHSELQSRQKPLLRMNGEDVGTVNSPGYSHRLGKSLALVHLSPGACTPGTQLELVSDDLNTTATVEAMPFFDPSKSRTHRLSLHSICSLIPINRFTKTRRHSAHNRPCKNPTFVIPAKVRHSCAGDCAKNQYLSFPRKREPSNIANKVMTTPQEKIQEILNECSTGKYIFRGENKEYGKVSSGLYRQYCQRDDNKPVNDNDPLIDNEHFLFPAWKRRLLKR